MTRDERELTCREVNDFLAAYLAGELSAARRARFEAHVAECPDCAVFLRQYAGTIRLAKRAHDDLPADLPEGLVEAILASAAPPTRRGGRRKRRS